MSIYSVTGAELRDMVCYAASLLEKNKKTIDALNVFPVPDGDTGTNMSLTMQMAAKEIQAAAVDTVGQAGSALSMGSLKGARGNSGVILSQIFRGFSKGIQDAQEMDPKTLAEAMDLGAQAAYKAVMKPKEGTILTVVRSMADAAKAAAGKHESVLGVVDYMLEEGEKTLQKTPELLPVLKEAGVVDSGGAGLLTIFRGFKMSLEGEELPEGELKELQASIAVQSEATETENIEFGYCTEFFVKNNEGAITDEDIDKFRAALDKIGDCVLVVGDASLLKVHVHTENPGRALQYGQKLGYLSGMKIENMREQKRDTTDFENFGVLPEEKKKPEKEMGFVTVAAGSGLAEIFRDLGVDEVVEGGQSMNPSIEDIAKAIQSVSAETVFVLPNNKNIILAAEQAAQLCEQNVIVIPSRSIPQGIAGMISFLPNADVETNHKTMVFALGDVQTGMITYAIRDSQFYGKQIHEGDILGIQEDDVVACGEDVTQISLELLERMVDDTMEIITVYYGEDISKEQAEALCAVLEEKYPDCDVQVNAGGQPLYYYIFSVE